MAESPRKKSTRQSKTEVSSSASGGSQSAGSVQPPKTSLGIKVFISYSRKDKDFATTLVSHLTALGFDVWVDWENVSISSEWQKEIQKTILTSHVFLFLISPDSVESQQCMQEFKIAEVGDKRIFPILIRDPDSAIIPEELNALNWMFMRTPDELDAALPKLSDALQFIGKTTTLDFAQNDRPTGKDQLDYQAYARAFAQILASPHTKPPLTVGLYASLGYGQIIPDEQDQG